MIVIEDMPVSAPTGSAPIIITMAGQVFYVGGGAASVVLGGLSIQSSTGVTDGVRIDYQANITLIGCDIASCRIGFYTNATSLTSITANFIQSQIHDIGQE